MPVRIHQAAILLFLSFASIGHAIADGVAPSGQPIPELAIAINPLPRWFSGPGGRSVAVSGYAGIGHHNAIRANVAAYDGARGGLAGAIVYPIATVAEGDGDGVWTYDGGILDVGVAWMYFPRRLWSGFSIEAGVLRRGHNTHEVIADISSDVFDKHTATYAAEVLVGWTWLIQDRIFISLTGGVSAGYERGTESTGHGDGEPMQTTSIKHTVVEPEGFLRIGTRFSL